MREVVSLARKKRTPKKKGEELFCEKRKTKSKKASTKKKGDDQNKIGVDFAADIKNKSTKQKKGEELFAPPPEKVSVPFTEKDRIIPTFCESPSTGKNGEIH